jgi:hypothetical protein
MKVYVVIVNTITAFDAYGDAVKTNEVDSIWFTEEDAYERVDQLESDETTNWDYYEVRAMEVHGKQHLKVISKVIEDDERK